MGLTEDHRDMGRRMRVTMVNTVTHWILLREVDSVNDCFFSNLTGLETVGRATAGRFVFEIERGSEREGTIIPTKHQRWERIEGLRAEDSRVRSDNLRLHTEVCTSTPRNRSCAPRT